MRPLPLVLALALSTALLVPAATAWPPVCIEKGASAFRTSVHVQVTCGPQATVYHCPPVGDGACLALTSEQLLP